MADALGGFGRLPKPFSSDKLTDVVLLGMGGSSLAPEVLRADPRRRARLAALPDDRFDRSRRRSLRHVAARTDAVRAREQVRNDHRTEFAGRALPEELERAGVGRWADHFVAITDEGTELAHARGTDGFREVFINPADIGGRYSALSFFGLVPAALMGHDVEAILGWGIAMLDEAAAVDDSRRRIPAVGPRHRRWAPPRGAGRDKATLVMPPLFEPFGLWVEQLVAESTGKQGVGIVPIAGEAVGSPDVYGERSAVRPPPQREQRRDARARGGRPAMPPARRS